MNIEDLSKVESLQSQLRKATLEHDAAMSLTAKNGGNFGLDARAYVSLGGDIYGNGTMHKFEILIKDSPEMVRVCRKLQSDAWGVVVSLRARIRFYGVNLDTKE